MQDIADHTRGLGQVDGAGLDLAADGAVDKDGIGDDLALDMGGFADEKGLGADIAVNGAVDLYFTVAAEVADDLEVGADDRRRRRFHDGF
jgi:hypothetical protein